MKQIDKKIRMKTLLLVLLAAGLIHTSCTREPLDSSGAVPVGSNVELRFEAFNSKATSEPDDAVERVRIVIFGSENSDDRGKFLCNTTPTIAADSTIAPVIITSGVRDIYLIVNEPLATDNTPLDAYKNIKTVKELEALELAYTAGTNTYHPSPIPMFIKHIGRSVYVDNKNVTNSEIERMMAKVTLNLNIKNDNFGTNTAPTIKTITIKNLPKNSYYIAKPYAGDLVNSETQIATEVTTVATYDYSSTNTFYVPEYILSNLNDNAYIEIIGSAGTKETKWIVKLGNAMDLRYQGGRYDITRNGHYIITGDVKSYGEVDGLDVTVSVEPWGKVTGGSGVGEFLTVSTTNVRLINTRPNTTLTLKSNDLSIVKITSSTVGLVSAVLNRTNGDVTITSIGAASATHNRRDFVPSLTTLTFTQGRHIKTVTVDFEPLVWAPGDIALERDPATEPNSYVFGHPGHARTLLFPFGSHLAIGLVSTDAKENWNGLYYHPGSRPNLSPISVGISVLPSNTTFEKFIADLTSYNADPCAYVESLNKWRIPTQEEFVLLNATPGILKTSLGVKVYEFSAFKNVDGTSVNLPSYFYERDFKHEALQGYYWTKTDGGVKDNVALGSAFIANNDYNTPTRINNEPKTCRFKVRCVRDFRDKN